MGKTTYSIPDYEKLYGRNAKEAAIQIMYSSIEPMIEAIAKQLDEQMVRDFQEQEILDQFNLGCFKDYYR